MQSEKITIDEFTRARIARAAVRNRLQPPPWVRQSYVIDEDADHDGAVYIGSVGLLDTFVCYVATSSDGLLLGGALGIACIITLLMVGRWALKQARRPV